MSSEGAVPGAVALLARGEQVEVQAVGAAAVGGAVPMARDSIFRIASITKPITAAAVMMLVDDGRVALEDPVERWLPELASRVVVRTPEGPGRRRGAGRPADHRARPAHLARRLRLAVGLLAARGPDAVRHRAAEAPSAGRVARAARRASRCSTSRARRGCTTPARTSRASLDRAGERAVAARVLRRAAARAARHGRHRLRGPGREARPAHERLPAATDGGLELADAPDGELSRPPAFASGSGGLVSTADDWHRFARLLLGGGTLDGRRLLSAESVRQMTTNHLTAAQREVGDAVPRGPGMGLRRLGRRRGDRPVERAGALRLGRRHRDDGPHRPVHRHGRDPAHPGLHDQPGRARDHARLLALRGRLGARHLDACARRARRSGRCASPPRGSRRARRGGSRRAG